MVDNRLIYLIRHGQTKWNLEERRQGGSDSPLTSLGLDQAARIAANLKSRPPAMLYASPLNRARRTAAIIAEAFDIGIETDERLTELSCGEAEGLTFEEIDHRWPTLRKRRELEKWTTPWPGGECYRDVHDRLTSFVTGTLSLQVQAPDAAPLGIVGHETMNMILLGHLLSLDPAMIIRLGQPNHVIYRLSGLVVDHAFLGDEGLAWQAGAMQKRSDKLVLHPSV